MKANKIDMLINTISRAAEDSGVSQNEMMLALAYTMAGLMEKMGSNLMDVKMDDRTLAVGLRDSTGTSEKPAGRPAVH
ncbi:MAG TPA: hypothetical protein VGI71_23545 [Scandinavium sp.]|jgi:hypothetical protein